MRISPLSILTPVMELVPSVKDLTVQVKDTFRQNMADGWYQSKPKGICIYRITADGRAHTGVLALNDIRDFHQGKIKKHERTLTKREAEYHLLLRDWQAVIKPVLLTFPPNAALSAWITGITSANNPDFTIEIPETADRHQYWIVQDAAQVQRVQAIFEAIPAVYIADGHHRTTTIAHLANQTEAQTDVLDFQHLFAAYFPDDQLDILGYHRVVRLDSSDAIQDFWQKLNIRFTLYPLNAPRLPQAAREVVTVFEGQAYAFNLNEGAETDEQNVLDAALLNSLVFTEILGATDIRTDKRITYSDGATGLGGVVAAAGKGTAAVGLLLFPVSVQQLYRASDLHEVLPPKSTWFEPRIKSGLAVFSLQKS